MTNTEKFLRIIVNLSDEKQLEVLDYMQALEAGNLEKCRAMEAAHGMSLETI